MAFRVVRNDITGMKCEAIVNSANPDPSVGGGCDLAIYKAAGYDELLEYRKNKIGYISEGEAVITPGFNLSAKYIIHTVCPKFTDSGHGGEYILRSCYRNVLKLAGQWGISSIAFPLIATGSLKYPREEGLRIAADEIGEYLESHDMDVYLVVFDARSTELGKKFYPALEAYIDCMYVEERLEREHRGRIMFDSAACASLTPMSEEALADYFEAEGRDKLNERMSHMSDTFTEYLMYLIESKGLTNAEVYNGGAVNKRVFSKIKQDPYYHPQKITVLCLCIGARLNLDETKDLLARAGYALSPCNKTDVIFSFFIEQGFYDITELDIQLGEHGEDSIIE